MPEHMSRRPSLHNPFSAPVVPDIYSDSRTHGPEGRTRQVRMQMAATPGGGAISKNEDGSRCVVAGRESLRILRVCDPNSPINTEHKYSLGHGGWRIDASRNFWNGSGLKIDSVSTDVAWAHGMFNTKIITSARNGEIIMWDLNKSGQSKYERRTRQHVRSIHKLAYSPILQYYCITASADGDLRVWDLRDLTDSIMKIHHPASVRSVVFSPVHWQPRHAITGLDNGNIYRWDLNMGQRGQLDRIALAHSGPILALDWTLPSSFSSNAGHRTTGSSGSSQGSSNWYAGVGSGLFDDLGSGNATPGAEAESNGNGWLASGGLDRTVKVWDITVPSGGSHIPRKPVYTLYTSFPVRRVAWRPNYECELAVTSYQEGSANSQPNPALDLTSAGPSSSPRFAITPLPDLVMSAENKALYSRMGDPVELWDVRRGYIAKWSVRGSAIEGGVTDVAFADSHTLWAQHFSGSFSQLDLRLTMKPIDAVPRTSLTWEASGSLLFVADRPKRWEIPYDDIHPDKKMGNKRKLKTLGDKPYSPTSQTICMTTGRELEAETESFVRLAQTYRFHGMDRPAICAHNAEVALDADRPDAAQTWLLLESLLSDISETEVPSPESNMSHLPIISPKFPHSASAPAAIPTLTHLPPDHPMRSFSEDPYISHVDRAAAGSRAGASSSSRSNGNKARTYSSSTHSISSMDKGYLSPLRTTPVSSTAPSPHHPSTPLPQASTSVQSSVMSRRPSAAGLPIALGGTGPPPTRPRLGSSFRRPSFNAQSFHGGSALESESRTPSHSNLKHIGEGVLEDTDSEDGDSGDNKENADAHSDAGSDTEGRRPREGAEQSADRPSTSRSGSHVAGYWNQRSASVQPSPLSRIAGQQTWTEDEREEEDSPSPASTDNSEPSSDEYDDVPPYKPHHRARRDASRSRRSSTRSARGKPRSRSSTVASLSVATSPVAAIATPTRVKLTKQESQSSIRTVTATETPTSTHAPEAGVQSGSLSKNDTIRRVSGSSKYPASVTSAVLRQEGASMRSSSALSHNRPRSGVFYDDDAYGMDREQAGSRMTRPVSNARLDDAYKESIRQSEARLRNVGWTALQETLEVLADEGDVQMCAMLALVVPEELKIGPTRALRFIESYIDLLMRMRLHTIAAYIRKFVPAEKVRTKTEVDTTVYTFCAKCRKPVLQPSHNTSHNRPTGVFSYCHNCSQSFTTCSICRLPVRALLFLCPVCQHGGHQACYQQYHLNRPLIPISNPSPPAEAQTQQPAAEPRLRRATSKTGDGDGSDDGASTRDGDEGSPAVRFPDALPNERRVLLSGHPCAAGCGHYCWATNDPLLHDSAGSDV